MLPIPLKARGRNHGARQVGYPRMAKWRGPIAPRFSRPACDRRNAIPHSSPTACRSHRPATLVNGSTAPTAASAQSAPTTIVVTGPTQRTTAHIAHTARAATQPAARGGASVLDRRSFVRRKGSRRETALSKVRRNTRLEWIHLPFREDVKPTNTQNDRKECGKKKKKKK